MYSMSEDKKDEQQDAVAEPVTAPAAEPASGTTNVTPPQEAAAAPETPTETDEDEEVSPREATLPTETESVPAQVVQATDLRPGMTVRVHERIKDVSAKGEERQRIQIFQGIVLGMRGAGITKTMTIRREQKGYGVEKIYPLHSPVIAKVEVVKVAKVRRAKLNFLSDLRHRFKRKLKETWNT